MKLQKNCVIAPKKWGSRDGELGCKEQEKDRLLVWAEYIALFHKILLIFQTKNIFYTFCNFVPMPLFKFGKHQGKGN